MGSSETSVVLPVFNPELVVFIDHKSNRNEVLSILTEKLKEEGKVTDTERFINATLSREKIVSTAIGHGVAIPHAKLDGYEEFFLAIGILTKEGVDWGALDHGEVRIVFLIGGPSNRQTEYLQILSSITQAIRNPDVRDNILMSSCPQAVINELHF